MKLKKTVIALGISTASAASLCLLKVNNNYVVAYTALIVGTGLMIALRDKNNLNIQALNYEYFFNRAQDIFEVGNYEEAILYYNRALELAPTEISLVYSMRGNAKCYLGDFNGAISDQNKALTFDPLYADGYFYRSSAKLKMKNFTGAIEDYTKVIEINPKDSDAFFNRAHVKKELGDFKGACEDWRKGAELGDEDATQLIEKHYL